MNIYENCVSFSQFEYWARDHKLRIFLSQDFKMIYRPISVEEVSITDQNVDILCFNALNFIVHIRSVKLATSQFLVAGYLF